MSYYHHGQGNRSYISREQYLDYLKSDEWKAKAEARRKIDKGICQLCRKESNMLEVHHLSYFHIQNEDIYTDLVSLCPDCHEKIHKMMCRVTSPDGRRGWADLPYIDSREGAKG